MVAGPSVIRLRGCRIRSCDTVANQKGIPDRIAVPEKSRPSHRHSVQRDSHLFTGPIYPARSRLVPGVISHNAHRVGVVPACPHAEALVGRETRFDSSVAGLGFGLTGSCGRPEMQELLAGGQWIHAKLLAFRAIIATDGGFGRFPLPCHAELYHAAARSYIFVSRGKEGFEMRSGVLVLAAVVGLSASYAQATITAVSPFAGVLHESFDEFPTQQEETFLPNPTPTFDGHGSITVTGDFPALAVYNPPTNPFGNYVPKDGDKFHVDPACPHAGVLVEVGRSVCGTRRFRLHRR